MNLEAWMAKQEKRLEMKQGKLQRYPKTLTMLFLLAVAAILLVAAAWQAVFPPPPPEPTLGSTPMTAAGFVNTLLTLELPGIWWAVIFLFLWMTKWS